MSTDASLTGWGACIDTTTTGGDWTPDDDINYLEILAVFLALQSFSVLSSCLKTCKTAS